jgi:hypothetical protein
MVSLLSAPTVKSGITINNGPPGPASQENLPTAEECNGQRCLADHGSRMTLT